MTRKTEFPLHLMEIFTFDIFGSQKKVGEETILNKGLLQKDLMQPIKIHLKRLGNKLMEEDKLFKEQMTSLREEYFNKEGEQLVLKEGFTIENINKKAIELSNTKIEIEHFDFQLEDFNFRGDEVYEIIDFVTKEKEES
jgi:hypothetical protein